MVESKQKRNYHMWLRNLFDGRWVCEYCGATGTHTALRSTDCSYEYEPCKACGGCEESNECKPDCPGMAALLADPSIYVAGKIGDGDG